MMVKFVAIDMETANPDLSSICQIGLVTFESGQVAEIWQRLVNPEDEFDGINVSIHGIDEEAVRDAATLPQIFSELQTRLQGQVVVSHTSFDRTALCSASEKYHLPSIDS